MKKIISLILFPFLFISFGAKANDNFSVEIEALTLVMEQYKDCLLYTSDAADEFSCVDLGGRRIIKKNPIELN